MRVRIVVLALTTLLLSLSLAGSANASLATKLMVGKDGGLGGLGLGFGQLLEPRDADIGPDGEIYVLVPYDCSVRVFSATGVPLRNFGGCPATNSNPSGNELFYNPTTITVDAKSRVYVGSPNLLAVTDRDGTVLTHFGTLNNAAPFATSPTYSAVTDANPSDPDGATSLFVTNASANRVEKYSVAYDDNAVSFDWAAGEDVKNTDGNTGYEVCTVFSECKSGISGSVGFSGPQDVDIATASGPLWVGNPYNSIARVNPSTGAKLGTTVLDGSVSAIGIAARSDGAIWVAPAGYLNGQVLVFDATGAKIDEIGTYQQPSAASDAIGSAVGLGSGQGGARLAVADSLMHRVAVYNDMDANVLVAGKNDGIGWQQGSGTGEFAGVKDAVPDGAGGFWALDSGNKRVVRFDNTGAVTQTIVLSTIGNQFGVSPYGPMGMGISSNGAQLYVADSWNNRIIRFDIDVGAHTSTFNRMAGRDVDSANPSTDSEICTVQANCKVGLTGTDPQSFSFPVDVTVAPNGAVWVVEQNNHRLQRFDSLFNWGSTVGTGASSGSDGGFQYPQAVAFESDDSFWVADSYRLQKFDAAGAFVKKFAPGYTTPQGTFGAQLLFGLAVVGSNLYVVESGLGRVAIYPTSTTGVGAILPPSTFGAIGSNAGQFYQPRGISAIGSDFLVADDGNSRVQWIGEDALAPPAGTITITSPTAGQTFVNKLQIQLDFAAVNADGDAMTCTPPAGSMVPLPSVGSNTIHVACDDPLNAADVTKDVQVTRVNDPFAPTVVIDAPVDGATVTSSPVTLDFGATDDQDPGALDCDRTSGDSIALTPGLNTITVSCEDWGGNIGSASATITYAPPKPPDTTPPPAAGDGTTKLPTATITLPKKIKFKGKVTATVTCDIACPLVFAVSVKVGRKTYKASAKGSLAAAGSLKLTAKFKKSATKTILAAKKLPKLKYTLSYGAKAGKSGSVKMSR
jgi:sugar lactone lactonase YvrE